MQENKKRWMELCDQAADEQDPKKLAVLILQINFMFEAKECCLMDDTLSHAVPSAKKG